MTPATRGHAERPRTPQAIFSRVAPYYDVFNSVLSLARDKQWRSRAARALRLAPRACVLDVATGTGALAIEIARRGQGRVSVTGCDLNDGMLKVAARNVRRAKVDVRLVHCDAASLPFEDESFDAATLAFAIDDMPDRAACVRELRRVLRPGGRLALLELSQPDVPLVQWPYRRYLRLFRLLSAFSIDGYRHLEQEILHYRGPRAIEELLVTQGFTAYTREMLSLGIARLHVAERAG